MPRMISFALTTKQFIEDTKDVTRRVNWRGLREGDTLMAVKQAMGLGKGGKVQRLGLIRVKSVRREPLKQLTDDPAYGRVECGREGFPAMAPCEFVEFFCRSHKGCTPETTVTRIEFEKAGWVS